MPLVMRHSPSKHSRLELKYRRCGLSPSHEYSRVTELQKHQSLIIIIETCADRQRSLSRTSSTGKNSSSMPVKDEYDDKKWTAHAATYDSNVGYMSRIAADRLVQLTDNVENYY